MKLWKLHRAFIGCSDAPELVSVVVRAECEAEARGFARQESCNEDGWLDDEVIDCVELEARADGVAGVVLAQWIGSAQADDQEYK